jgi:hypothetical protein
MLHLFSLSTLSFCVLVFGIFFSFLALNARPPWVFWPGCAPLEDDLLLEIMQVSFVRILRVPQLLFFHLPFLSVDRSSLFPSLHQHFLVPALSSPDLFAESRQGLQIVNVVNVVKVMKGF